MLYAKCNMFPSSKLLKTAICKLCFAIFLAGIFIQPIVAISPVGASLRLYDFYFTQVEKDMSLEDKSGVPFLLELLKEHKDKLTALHASKTLTPEEEKDAEKRMKSFEDAEKAYLDSLQKTQKTTIPKPEYHSFLNYHSTQGSIIGSGIDWAPQIDPNFDLKNQTEISFADSALGSVTYGVNNAFPINQNPVEFDITGYSDPTSVANSNIQFDLNETHKQSLLGHDNVDVNMHAQTRFQTKNNNAQVTWASAKNIDKKSVKMGYIGNFAEVASGGYQQAFASLSDNAEHNVWGYTHTYSASSRLTMYPDDGKRHTLYLGLKNFFKSRKSTLRSNLLVNYVPNEGFGTHLLFRNRLNNKAEIGPLSNYGVIWDWKQSVNSAIEYVRLGGNTQIVVLDSGPIQTKAKIGLDYYNFSTKSSSYNFIYVKTIMNDQRPAVLFPNLTTRLGRRSYPSNTSTAWSLDFSDVSAWTLWNGFKVDRSSSLNLVKFDNPTGTQSDSLALSTGIQNRQQFDELTLQSSLSITYQHYSQNRGADNFALLFSNQLTW
ncbi:MAG: hypothetical protein ACI9BD_001340 [Candidatus Marinamargulisbacteria bacterium]|jgi:hypothetical protein